MNGVPTLPDQACKTRRPQMGMLQKEPWNCIQVKECLLDNCTWKQISKVLLSKGLSRMTAIALSRRAFACKRHSQVALYALEQ